jgi:hypothetical protein
MLAALVLSLWAAVQAFRRPVLTDQEATPTP